MEHRVVGVSEEDAFGDRDPLQAVERATAALQQRNTDAEAAAVTGTHTAEVAKEGEGEVDPVASARNRRRNRQKRSLDVILGDVLHDALLMREKGQRPDTDFVYRRAQERMYEQEYGRRPPSAKNVAAKYIPFPPDFHMHRLLPLYEGDAEKSGGGGARGLRACYLLEEDPWPERAVTPANPAWTRAQVEADKRDTGGKGLQEAERKMYEPREGYDVAGEFLDAMDELAYWEVKYLEFLREAPLPQRRSLPYLHEFHRLFVHRLLRAEQRYITTRNAALAGHKASASVFAHTEEAVERVRGIYAEAHRSLSSPNYDPLRMKKSPLKPFMAMSAAEFEEWKAVQTQRRNLIIGELS